MLLRFRCERRAVFNISFARGNIIFIEIVTQIGAVVRVAVAQDIRDAVDEHRCFSAACACQNEQRAVYGEHGLLLAVIHARKVFFQHCAAQCKNFRFIHRFK